MKKTSLSMVVAAATVALSLPSYAQVLEEVVVTATKKQEVGLHDVPIAISVVDGDKMLEQGWMSLQAVTSFLPNVTVTETFSNDAIFIRGIGSGSNFGFEQSVGTFIDGVYFGRGQASRTTFLDIDRVEVLKGSQATLFGKNTIAGALNITTKKPGQEFEASIEATYEEPFGAWRTTGILSGPLTDNFGARLVVQGSESDGFIDNVLTGESSRQQEDLIGRLVLDWQATDTLSATLKLESGETDSVGPNEVIRIATERTQEIWATQDPNIGAVIGSDDKRSMRTFDERPEFFDREWGIVTLNVQYGIGEYTLQSITGWIDYRYDNNRDVDYSPLQAINRSRSEEHEQFTQEFLLSSPQSDTFEYLTGIYYQNESLENDSLSDVSAKNLWESGASIPPVLGIPTGNLDITNHNAFTQDTETWSLFAEGTFHVNEAMRVIAGIRYSEDEKEFSKRSYFRHIFEPANSPAPDDLGTLIFAYNNFLRFANQYTFENGQATIVHGAPTGAVMPVTSPMNTVREEDHWTGDVTFQWDATDMMMVYAKYSTGYKAGGFDENNSLGIIDAAEFEDETSEAFEIGAKMDLFEGRGRLNISAFMSEFDNVQVSTFDGVANYTVGNAAKTSSNGIEIDGQFAVTDGLTVYGSVAYLDAVYDSFKNAPCYFQQAVDWNAAGNTGPCTQDVSGKPTEFAPKYSAMLGADYMIPLTTNLELTLGADLAYSDSFFTINDYDPATEQGAFTKFNARIALGDAAGKWFVALVVKNLTDEITLARSGDIPLGSLGFGNSYVDSINPPRSVQLQARYNF